jgi:hypothetical protein
MTNVMTEDNVATLGAATEASLQHTYERALKRKNAPASMEGFIEHVIDRGIAEIERTWKSAEKTEERNKLAKVAVERLRYLRLKLKNGDTLTEAEENFMAMFKGIAIE